MQSTQRIYFLFSMLGAFSIFLSSCSDPLSLDVERRIIPVNIDSILLSEPFLEKNSDSLFAVVNGRPVAFNNIQRPAQYNREKSDAWYLAVEGTRFFDLKTEEYEVLALRLDAIRDTGTYQMRGDYTIPKQINLAAQSEYSGQYSQLTGSGLQSFYSTSRSSSAMPDGEIRVVGLDKTRGVIVGTFRFTGYDTSGNETMKVHDGIFRLQLELP